MKKFVRPLVAALSILAASDIACADDLLLSTIDTGSLPCQINGGTNASINGLMTANGGLNTCVNGLLSSGTVTNPTGGQVILGPIDTSGAGVSSFQLNIASGSGATINVQESTSSSGPWINVTGYGSTGVATSFNTNSAVYSSRIRLKFIQAISSAATEVFTVSGNLRSAPGADATSSPSVLILPSSSSTFGITPIVSSVAEATHVLKVSSGNLYSTYATNLTSTAGFLVIVNATSAPADGAIVPLDWCILPANGSCAISYGPAPPDFYGTGITAVLTSAVTPFTKTTGVITGSIHAQVQ